MIYVVGMYSLDPPVPVVVSRHRTYDRGLLAARDALTTKPTVTRCGVWVHDAEGTRNALDIAIIRTWAETAARTPEEVE